MGRPNLNPAVGDRVEIIPSVSAAMYGTGPSITAIIIGKGREQGQPVVDYKTGSGAKAWAYLWQVVAITNTAVPA